jgi:hypothetical protein
MGKPTTFSMIKKNGIFYEIDGLERDRFLERKTVQNGYLTAAKKNHKLSKGK